ncbi:hypothetical protein [Streptomyces lienomycini]|uniref:Uncharacterized protein n=1 Tax=Streptomyces lienomycini TaxID=284035 RepID=A0ABV9WN89_9ACTN|nr:hypothetical protein [Streptomyces lienomycini]
MANQLVKLFGGVGGEAVDALKARCTDQAPVLDVLEQSLAPAGCVRQPLQQVPWDRDDRVEPERETWRPDEHFGGTSEPAFS